MYYLKTQTFDVRFILFLYFFIMGAYSRFSRLATCINHISKSDTGIILPLFLCSRYYSNRCLVCFLTNSGCANTCCGLLPGMLVMFAPFFILSSGHCYNTTF